MADVAAQRQNGRRFLDFLFGYNSTSPSIRFTSSAATSVAADLRGGANAAKSKRCGANKVHLDSMERTQSELLFIFS